jgi:hypothetical protein
MANTASFIHTLPIPPKSGQQPGMSWQNLSLMGLIILTLAGILGRTEKDPKSMMCFGKQRKVEHLTILYDLKLLKSHL